jgi:hypothetical protein
MSVITDWRTKEDDLPDVAPGEEYEYVIAPQKFVVLHRIRVVNSLPRGDLTLVRLKIGAIEDVPFELDSVDGLVRTYRLKGLDDEALKKNLVRIGAAVVKDAIAIMLLDVRAVLRNEGTRATKPRAALIVQEEEAP